MFFIMPTPSSINPKPDYRTRIETLKTQLNSLSVGLNPNEIEQAEKILQELTIALEQEAPKPPILIGKGMLFRLKLKKFYGQNLKRYQKTMRGVDRQLGRLEKELERRSQQSKRFAQQRQVLLTELQSFISDYQDFILVYGHAMHLANPDFLNLCISEGGEVLSISTEARMAHVYCSGGTGVGKSKLIESLVLQDLINGHGAMLIDPMGSLFRNLSAFCLRYEEIRQSIKQLKQKLDNFIEGNQAQLESIETVLPRLLGADFQKLKLLMEIWNTDIGKAFPPLNVKIIDLTHRGNEILPNPWRINMFQLEKDESVGEAVDTILKSIERHMAVPMTETPRLRLVLQALFAYCMENHLQIRELWGVLKMLQFYAGQGTKNANKLDPHLVTKMEQSESKKSVFYAQYIMDILLKFSKHDFISIIESTINRISLFLDNEVVSYLLDTPLTTLPLTDLINSSEPRRPFILVNLPSSQDGANMLATYLLTKMDKIIFRRIGEDQKKPFFCYIDEFHKFIDDKLAENFSGTRQFSLGYIVAHQNKEQLLKDDPEGYRFGTILGNCDTKLIMRTNGKGAEFLAEQCFELTGKLEKITYSTSEGEQESFGYSTSKSNSESTNEGTSTSESDSENWGKTVGVTIGESHSQSNGTSSSASQTNTENQGTSTGTKDGISEKMYQSHDLDGTRTTGTSSSKTISTGLSTGHTTSGSQTVSTGTTKSQNSGSSEGGGKTKGTSQSKGKTVGFSTVNGESRNHGHSSSKTTSHGYYGLREELMFLTQGIKQLAKRELFVCFPQLITRRAKTLDSLTTQMEPYMSHIMGEQFYPYLMEAQAQERQQMKVLLEEGIKEPEDEETEKSEIDTPSIFNRR